MGIGGVVECGASSRGIYGGVGGTHYLHLLGKERVQELLYNDMKANTYLHISVCILY